MGDLLLLAGATQRRRYFAHRTLDTVRGLNKPSVLDLVAASTFAFWSGCGSALVNLIAELRTPISITELLSAEIET
jgi:hypothetical protein